MQIGSAACHSLTVVRPGRLAGYHRLASGSDADDPSPKVSRFGDDHPAGGEDLPFKVELWNEARTSVEQVLAVTASGSIGYAAYYAAAREYPDRYVTLRHKNSIVSRSNPPGY
jgi:hypothetical protein